LISAGVCYSAKFDICVVLCIIQTGDLAMKPATKKLVEKIAGVLLDAAHETSRHAVNEATRLVHAELQKRKQKSKVKLANWAKK
jgi:hypothetical protein